MTFVRGPVSTFFSMSILLPFDSSLPSSLPASASSSPRDQNPSKQPGQAVQQSWAGGDTCLAWTSEDQISSAMGHGHKNLTKPHCADALLDWPTSVSTPLPIHWRKHQSTQGA